MAGHAQLKFVMTECSKTQIRLTGLIWFYHILLRPKDADRIVNSVDPDQTAPSGAVGQSVLGLHCLPRLYC